jgi:formyltetrahydrofolate deformylase
VSAPADRRGRAILTLACPDVPGIVHAVAGHLFDHGCTIVESRQFEDPFSGTFFMRVEFAQVDGGPIDLAVLDRGFTELAGDFGMAWQLEDAARRPRVVLMVSRFGHCLNDLLYRTSIGDIPMEVVAVVSNHPDLERLSQAYEVPFVHIPVSPDTKPQAEAELLQLVQRRRVDLVVLARYMQVLSDDACKQLEGRAINIHHSMLPSFKGAKPYQQAHARGVKLIGATAHYVTADLDEGPIIEQETLRVDHSMSPEQFAALGREAECLALARAVRWHCERRIILNGSRTVVFR